MYGTSFVPQQRIAPPGGMDAPSTSSLCAALVRTLSEAPAWHHAVTNARLPPLEILERVVASSPNISTDGAQFTLFGIGISYTSAPPRVRDTVVELIRRKCFGLELMTGAFAFRWRNFSMDSFVETKVDRVGLAQQAIASLRIPKGDVLTLLDRLSSTKDHFIKQRCVGIKGSIQSFATPPDRDAR